jgi:hypothetical protein
LRKASGESGLGSQKGGRPRVWWAWPASIHGLFWADTHCQKWRHNISPNSNAMSILVAPCAAPELAKICPYPALAVLLCAHLAGGGHRFVDSGIHCGYPRRTKKFPACPPPKSQNWANNLDPNAAMDCSSNFVQIPIASIEASTFVHLLFIRSKSLLID